jgi:AcrR family transcriptional regulator
MTAFRPAPPLRERSPRTTQIVQSACELVEQEGPEALTMRRLGEVVGMRAPSLYKHLPGKTAVTGAVVELAMRELGAALHDAVADEAAAAPIRLSRLLAAYRKQALASPHLYRLATSGPLARDQLSPGLEDWAGEPFFLVTGEPYLAQALWSATHGTVILELDGRYLPGSDLERTWGALSAAFGAALRSTPEQPTSTG